MLETQQVFTITIPCFFKTCKEKFIDDYFVIGMREFLLYCRL